MYSTAIVHTDAFKELQKLYSEQVVIYLWDFDGYDFTRLFSLTTTQTPLGIITTTKLLFIILHDLLATLLS